MPDEMSFDTGAALGIPGLTAAHCVFGSGDITGQTLLISGGAGTVAHNAVQLAKWGGAKVIVTAAPDGFDRVRAAGADAVFEAVQLFLCNALGKRGELPLRAPLLPLRQFRETFDLTMPVQIWSRSSTNAPKAQV